MRAWLVLLLLPVAGAQLIPAYDQLPDPNEYGPCDLPPAEVFARLPVGLENLHFHNGTLYLTAFGDGLWQATPDGNVSQIVADPARPGLTPVDVHHSMMGVTSHGGALYVSQGQSLATPVDGRILRFETPGAPEYSVHAQGFDGVNGMAADAEGNLYVAHGFGEGVYKVAPDGSWALWKQLPSANGVSLHPDGEHIVLAAALDAGARVIAVPLDAPDQELELFTFNALSPLGQDLDPGAAVVPKLLDDLTVTKSGKVLATSHERLQTLLGDPETGTACVLIEHGASPTSVRIAHGFGPWDGTAFATDNDGVVWAVSLGEPATVAAEPAESQEPGGGSESTPVPVWLALAALLVASRLRR